MTPGEVWAAICLVLTWLPVMTRGEWTLTVVWAVFAVLIVVAAFFFGHDEEGR